ncbi:PAS domain-containing protein [Roseomonas stagni]|uniref:histidine kinase n=1 Tax=Falsiroseomonas algicola TaxID=2716930 RepID=A0A6M1LTV2_9PROT|nr:PAS domain S-box protein [Falsiroseomonas algicola]NGM23880.1 PAS domain-containing protein [Falsiroseomonas algicola]
MRAEAETGLPRMGGTMAARLRDFDWAATPLGDARAWPPAQRASVATVLAMPVPSVLLWGPGLTIAAHNDAYLALLGEKPNPLGRSFLEVWAEARERIEPQIARALAGETAWNRGQRFLLSRGGAAAEAWFDYGFSPVFDEDGQAAGVLHTAIEITPQMEAEAALRERTRQDLHRAETERERQRRLYEAILGNTPDLAYVWALDHRFIYANEGLLRMWGRSWDEAIGKNCLELGYPDWHAAMHDREIEQVVATGRPVRGEVPFAGTFGRRIYDYILVPVFDAEGRVEAVAGTTRDVTEARQVEAALRESEARFRLMADAVPQIVWITDATGRMEFFNRQFTDYTGAPHRSMAPAEVAAGFIHPEDGMAVVGAFQAALEKGTPFEIEHRIRSSAGEWRWFLARAEPYRDPATGQIIRWFGASVDIHDRKLAEAALRESEARWRGLFERMQEGVQLNELIRDETGRAVDMIFLQVNAAWERQTGLSRQAVVGRRASAVIPPEEAAFWAGTMAGVIESGEARHVERFVEALGRWYEVVVYPVEAGRAAALVTDVTARKAEAERQALLMREVDHRAKNALAVVEAALRLTQAPDVASFQQTALGRVSALARAQTLLSQDRWHGADLRALVEGELAAFVGNAGPRAVVEGARVVLPPGAAQPIAMALHELATNAVKYGALSRPEGRVAIGWRVKDGSRGVLCLDWVETGGPCVDGAPTRRGFGSRVLDATVRGQLSGGVTVEWRETGLVCGMEVPLRGAGAGGDEGEVGF